jgi:hypothetical protein
MIAEVGAQAANALSQNPMTLMFWVGVAGAIGGTIAAWLVSTLPPTHFKLFWVASATLLVATLLRIVSAGASHQPLHSLHWLFPILLGTIVIALLVLGCCQTPQ